MPPEAEAGLAEAAQELSRLGEETVPLVGRVFGAFEGAHPGEVDLLRAQAARLEAVHEALVRYLSRLSALGLAEAEAQLQHRLLFLARDLRAVTDLAVGKLLDLVEEQEGGGTTFSIEGLSQLRKFHTELVHDLDRVVRSLRAPDPAAEGAVLAAEAELPEKSRQLVLAHFERMAAGVKEAIESDALFLRAQAVLAEAYGLLAGMVRTLQRGGPAPASAPVPPPGPPETPAAGA
jgi:Na+/phosphate symporter